MFWSFDILKTLSGLFCDSTSSATGCKFECLTKLICDSYFWVSNLRPCLNLGVIISRLGEMPFESGASNRNEGASDLITDMFIAFSKSARTLDRDYVFFESFIGYFWSRLNLLLESVRFCRSLLETARICLALVL